MWRGIHTSGIQNKTKQKEYSGESERPCHYKQGLSKRDEN